MITIYYPEQWQQQYWGGTKQSEVGEKGRESMRGRAEGGKIIMPIKGKGTSENTSFRCHNNHAVDYSVNSANTSAQADGDQKQREKCCIWSPNVPLKPNHCHTDSAVETQPRQVSENILLHSCRPHLDTKQAVISSLSEGRRPSAHVFVLGCDARHPLLSAGDDKVTLTSKPAATQQ